MILWLSGTVEGTTLSENQLAKHDHGVPWHSTATTPIQGRATKLQSTGVINASFIITTETGGSTSHTHTISNITSGNASNFPLYYTLSFIMRLA